MTNDTVEKLNNLNKEFYERVAPVFDRTRSYYWEGWMRLIPLIKQRFSESRELRVLDIGCGNGRFGEFLRDHLQISLEYAGLDSNSFLLDKAREKFPKSHFIYADILEYEYDLLQQKFDLIALFGVIHHTPGYENRTILLGNLKNLLSNKGILAFSTWDFLNSPSLKKRIQPWSTISLENQVEENDYLLNWKKGIWAPRYCHNLTDEETNKLCSENSLKVLKTYFSNAQGDRYNKYFITSL